MKELTEGAFAKVNLTLDVLDKREDGYHNLRSIMQTVSLHDDVHVTVGCEGWQIHCYREVLPPDAEENTEPELVTCGLPQDRENLAWKAAEAFYARIGKKPEGLEIFINKRIPLEAGLGGGSADAAAVLRGVNALYELGLTQAELCAYGAKLGSDIPFTIVGGTMLATGRGEVLEVLDPVPPFWVVLAKPKISVSTAWAYKHYDEQGAEQHPDNAAIIQAIAKRDRAGIASLLCNVLERVTIKQYPVIAAYKEWMMEKGALASMMSGSGPTVFGSFQPKRRRAVPPRSSRSKRMRISSSVRRQAPIAIRYIRDKN